ncbi:hypothetical protein lerEdw1_017387 [Lerista edwardsae]|nr:hypothetical protein lerEdw1_017387 [Lerista edwardsae]
MSLVAEAFVTQIAAAEPWPENAALYQPLKEEQILLSDNAACLAVQAFLQMCDLPVKLVCRANAEYMSPSGKVPFIHVGNQVVSELGPIVQFVKAKGHSLSDGLDEVQKAEMKAYMELVNNMLLTAELYLQWCDDATVQEITHPRPTELDALVFGHLFTILTTQLISDELSEKVKSYSNLIAFCRRIEQRYFEGQHKDGSESVPPPELRPSLMS